MKSKSAYFAYITAFILAIACLLLNNLYIHSNFSFSRPFDFESIQFNPWVVDDAYISMRYAENFAEGKGLVFNEGEAVEGYTTFSWVVLLGLLHGAGFDLELLVPFLCIFFSIATLLLFSLVPRMIPDAPKYSGALAVILLGSSGIFTLWGNGSMEVPMAQFFILLSLLIHLKARDKQDSTLWDFLSAMACVLVAMSRPEGVLLFLVYFADRFYLSYKSNNASYFFFGLYFSMVFAPYLIWRFSYYGYPLPNTFYAKVSPNILLRSRDGLLYFSRFCSNTLFILAPVATLLLVAGGKTLSHQRQLIAPIIGACFYMLFIISAGGDHMPASRLFAPLLPILCVAAAIVFCSLVAYQRQLLIIAIVVLFWNQFNFAIAKDSYNRDGTGIVGRDGKVVGLWMRETFPPGTLIATNTAGSIPFYSKLPTIDMLGLNDEQIGHRDIPNMGSGWIGHEKGDGAYVLSRKPDYIQFGSAMGSTKPIFLSDREIAGSKDFTKQYTLKNFKMPNGRMLQLYARNAASPHIPPAQTKAQAQNVPTEKVNVTPEARAEQAVKPETTSIPTQRAKPENKAALETAMPVVNGETRKPGEFNVVVVLIDTLRADHLDAYGYHRPTAPFLKKLGEEGVLFENAISPAPWTREAVCSVFSGLYPSHSGSIGWEARPQENIPTMAEYFKKAGYATGGIVNTVMVYNADYARGFDNWKFPAGFANASGKEDKLTAEALNFVRACEDKKFFLYMHYLDPHSPYVPKLEFLSKFTKKPHPKPLDIYGNMMRSKIGEFISQGFGPGDPRFQDMVNRYDAELNQTDYHFGQFVNGLKKLGHDKDTFIVVLSDHGEEFMDHGYLEHGWAPYEESIHVPMIFWAPDRLKPMRITKRVSTINVLPTLLDITDIGNHPIQLDGQSLLNVSENEWQTIPQTIPIMSEMMAHHRGLFRIFYKDNLKYIAGQNWMTPEECSKNADRGMEILQDYKTGKLPLLDIWGPLTREALFDLGADPKEVSNLLELPGGAVPEDLKKMYEEYKKKCQEAAPTLQLPGTYDPAYTPEIEDSIKSLGYL